MHKFQLFKQVKTQLGANHSLKLLFESNDPVMTLKRLRRLVTGSFLLRTRQTKKYETPVAYRDMVIMVGELQKLEAME